MAHRGVVPHFDEEKTEDTKKKRKRRGAIQLFRAGVLYNASLPHCVHLSSKLSQEMNSAHLKTLHRAPRERDGLPSTFVLGMWALGPGCGWRGYAYARTRGPGGVQVAITIIA